MITLATSADTFNVQNDTEEIEIVRWLYEQKEYEYVRIEECYFDPVANYGYMDLTAYANEIALERNYGYENGEIPISDVVYNPELLIDLARELVAYPLLDEEIYTELEHNTLEEYIETNHKNDADKFRGYYCLGMVSVMNDGTVDYYEEDYKEYLKEQEEKEKENEK